MSRSFQSRNLHCELFRRELSSSGHEFGIARRRICGASSSMDADLSSKSSCSPSARCRFDGLNPNVGTGKTCRGARRDQRCLLRLPPQGDMIRTSGKTLAKLKKTSLKRIFVREKHGVLGVRHESARNRRASAGLCQPSADHSLDRGAERIQRCGRERCGVCGCGPRRRNAKAFEFWVSAEPGLRRCILWCVSFSAERVPFWVRPSVVEYHDGSREYPRKSVGNSRSSMTLRNIL
eukprot:scaffold143_cov260-Pinguiococcus_pyrenoidosus.AAC.33